MGIETYRFSRTVRVGVWVVSGSQLGCYSFWDMEQGAERGWKRGREGRAWERTRDRDGKK